ncbi:hypothetical protein ACFZB2_37275, partial [Streptomyces bobili]
MPIKPPESQDVPSGFDPAAQDPPIRSGVWGDNDIGPGLLGSSGGSSPTSPDGVIATGAGVLGVNTASQGIGVHGACREGTGISGTSTSGTGVHGLSRDGVGMRAAGKTGIVASGTQSAAQFTGNVGIGTATPSVALEIDRGTTDDVALLLTSSGPAWGSGLQLRNASDGATTYGTFSGADGRWHFTDTEAGADRMVIDQKGRIGLGLGASQAQRTLQVEGTGVHSGGPGGGFSFADRTTGAFVEAPAAGQRWEWYAQDGTARLWSGRDRLTVSTKGDGDALDVPRRMRVRQGGDTSAGIWLRQDASTTDRALVGMADDSHVGFWGNAGAQWGLKMEISTGDVAIGKLSISKKTDRAALDVPRRMRVRQGGDSTAGIWLLQDTPNNDRAFVGMADDTHVGFWGNTGAQWGLKMDTTTGDVAIGKLSITKNGQGGALDVPKRMRVRQGGDPSAGIWLLQDTPNNDRAFVGMADDTHVGFWGNTGAQWGLKMDTT